MGNGYKLAAITRIKGTFLQTITSQEEESECGAEKKELFSAKIHNPFSHIRPENVCSGCLCACGSMYFVTEVSEIHCDDTSGGNDKMSTCRADFHGWEYMQTNFRVNGSVTVKVKIRVGLKDPSATEQHVTKQYDWLISDRGPFHHSRSYLSFVERFRQGFTTRYKIYREFARWKVRNTAIERRDLIRNPVPLMPEFQRSVRLLGRRPTYSAVHRNHH
ncbi:BMP/retinoic acid-inducible neural-specific protein 1 [Collichthys lucidus]|uniref:BMP/retinoic acid-inducible neural-specific protein 1 n=1 Tax=Collichthys lucidus TaxID=240159 RepID=A0A4U5V9E8_COLLU|nr:BMP/retinoic acid-inducible neural-specific protein 1 [Collichthys lucidus]